MVALQNAELFYDRMNKAGRLTAESLCTTVACLQPEGTILVDESLTSGGSYWERSKVSCGPGSKVPARWKVHIFLYLTLVFASTWVQGCPRFSHLTLTGGSIGAGPALSIGAAVACPERLVINLQADGEKDGFRLLKSRLSQTILEI